MQRSKMERCQCRIIPCQQLVERSAEAVDIRTRRRLRLAILFRRGVAGRTKSGCILHLARFEMTGDAEVDQVDESPWCEHDVTGFEVAENDGLLARVQVVQHTTKLYTDAKGFL